MGLLDRIFGYRKIKFNTEKTSPVTNGCRNENCDKLMQFSSCAINLLNEKKYIAKSEFISLVKQYDEIINFFDVLVQSNMIRSYCDMNGVNEADINNAIHIYKNFEQVVDKHNDDYISSAMKEEKDYLDNVLKAVDPVVVLDEDQRKVILTDEDYCLVIAGAGAGKTTTVAAKVKYLVDKRNVEPSQILVVSFTNKAVNELKEKIHDALGVPCLSIMVYLIKRTNLRIGMMDIYSDQQRFIIRGL